jgi:oligoribonuclease
MSEQPAVLVWMDLEMTGLDPDRDTILEIATIITNGDLSVREEGPVYAIHQPQAVLDAMDEWNREHHAASGLTARVAASRVTMEEAESQTLELVRRHCAERSAPLCGNSIWQDRRFLVRYMPILEAYLHYRIVDVSSIKELAARWYPDLEAPKKRNAHLALDDIRESIAELRFYRENIFR